MISIAVLPRMIAGGRSCFGFSHGSFTSLFQAAPFTIGQFVDCQYLNARLRLPVCR